MNSLKDRFPSPIRVKLIYEIIGYRLNKGILNDQMSLVNVRVWNVFGSLLTWGL